MAKIILCGEIGTINIHIPNIIWGGVCQQTREYIYQCLCAENTMLISEAQKHFRLMYEAEKRHQYIDQRQCQSGYIY